MQEKTLKSSSHARTDLHNRLAHLIATNPAFDRSIVSFQANKREPFYRWFRYKEGFSSHLVHYCLTAIARHKGTLLDPFAGAGAALFASRELGWNATGVEVLPVGPYAMQARLAAEAIHSSQIERHLRRLAACDLSDMAAEQYEFPHIAITEGAFPRKTEQQLSGYLSYCHHQVRDPQLRRLLLFAAFSVLEDVSYTRKDGQYLRWDHRSPRQLSGRAFDKGPIPEFGQAIVRKLNSIAEDLSGASLLPPPSSLGAIDIRIGSSLDVLPTLPAGHVHFILTSPPYCNRYDYTRTYALELAFLGCDANHVKHLRQQMLSCTVENRDKVDYLRESYRIRSDLSTFSRVDQVFSNQAALQETLDALQAHKEAGLLNNANIPRMVWNYFYEMCFAIYEMARVLAPGGYVVMINDNVRYAGEEVPVDLILSDFASSFGLAVERIWYLPRGKGNSSQQMGAHGRQELRKSVYVWSKPAPEPRQLRM